MTDATLNENTAPGFSPDERFDTLGSGVAHDGFRYAATQNFR